MSVNVGMVDRILRIIVGLALIGVALGLYGPAYSSPWGWIGVVPLLTAFVGYCPAYTILGVRTCKAKSA